MTLPTTISAVTYAGNGVTTQFDWTFLIPSGALAVYRTENDIAVLLDPSIYSVSGLNDPNGGTVSFAQAPALGQTITIKRNVALTQDVALVTGSAFYAEVVEGAFDTATMQIQQLAEEMGRAVQVPIGSGLDPADYLDAAARSAAAASAAASSAAGSAGAAADSVIAAATAQSGSEAARDEAVAAVEAIDEAMANLGPATTTIAGIVRMATPKEVAEKTEPNAAVSPADLAGLASSIKNLEDITAKLNGVPVSIIGKTYIEFTGIPNDARRIRLYINRMQRSVNGFVGLIFGTDAAYDSSGYDGSQGFWGSSLTGYGNTSSRFLFPGTGWAHILIGEITLSRVGSTNTWFMNGLVGFATEQFMSGMVGSKTMSGPLSKLQISIDDGVFSSGSISLSWEK